MPSSEILFSFSDVPFDGAVGIPKTDDFGFALFVSSKDDKLLATAWSPSWFVKRLDI